MCHFTNDIPLKLPAHMLSPVNVVILEMKLFVLKLCSKFSCVPPQFQRKWTRAPSPSPPPSAHLTGRPWATLWSVPVAATTSASVWARSVTAWHVLRTSLSGSRLSTACTLSAGGERPLKDNTQEDEGWESYLEGITSVLDTMCLRLFVCVCVAATPACWLCLKASQTRQSRESAAATGRIAFLWFAGGIHEPRPSCCGLQASTRRGWWASSSPPTPQLQVENYNLFQASSWSFI